MKKLILVVVIWATSAPRFRSARRDPSDEHGELSSWIITSLMATKRAPAPGEAHKLIAHQARPLKAPRIAAHYGRLAEQGRAAGWSLEDYLAAVLAVESNARAESGARQRIRYAGFPAIKTITDFGFTAQPHLDRAQIARLEAGGWLAEKCVICVPPSSNGDVLEPDDKHKTV